MITSVHNETEEAINLVLMIVLYYHAYLCLLSIMQIVSDVQDTHAYVIIIMVSFSFY